MNERYNRKIKYATLNINEPDYLWSYNREELEKLLSNVLCNKTLKVVSKYVLLDR